MMRLSVPSRWPWLGGWIALLAPGLIYVGLMLFYTVPGWAAPRGPREILLWIVVFALLYLYHAGYQVVSQRKIPLAALAVSGALLGIAAMLIPPFHSTDIYGYINRGWQQLHYGMNPYVYTVDQIPGWERDPMITDHWVNNPSPYGFLYLLIAKGLCALGQGDKAATLLIFKLGNLVVHLLTALLLWLGSRALRQKEESDGTPSRHRPETALYLYLWNPLILLHGLANGHNDLFMGFFLLAGVYAALKNRLVWLLPALVAATLIKYGAVIVIPLALLLLAKRARREGSGLAGGLLLGGLLFVATGLPYLGDWSHFHLKEIGRNAFVSHGSIHAVVYSGFKTFAKNFWPAAYAVREAVREVLKNILLFVYGLFYAGLCLKRFRQKEYPVSDWQRDALLTMILLVCLISLKFYPWYLGMFFPLALLLPEGDRLRGFTIVLSGAQLFSITFIGQAHFLNFLVMTGLPLLWLLKRLRAEEWRPIPPSEPSTGAARK